MSTRRSAFVRIKFTITFIHRQTYTIYCRLHATQTHTHTKKTTNMFRSNIYMCHIYISFYIHIHLLPCPQTQLQWLIYIFCCNPCALRGELHVSGREGGVGSNGVHQGYPVQMVVQPDPGWLLVAAIQTKVGNKSGTWPVGGWFTWEPTFLSNSRGLECTYVFIIKQFMMCMKVGQKADCRFFLFQFLSK